MSERAAHTMTVTTHGRTRLEHPSLELCVASPRGTTKRATLGLGELVIGSGEGDGVVVSDDPRVSRRHCSLELTEAGLLLRDLGSKNGTFIGATRVLSAYVNPDVEVTIGETSLRVQVVGQPAVVALSPYARFGEALGGTLIMRALFALLETAAKSNETIVLLGESGTGKELLARGIHAASDRRDGPFVVVDCGAIPSNLIESELFGHAKGAFTGAATAREGLLAQANGGVLFLDEIGELPLELQPTLLRALEARQFRPVGSNAWQPFDARVVAATHRDLRQLVRQKLFREDLYFRLAVVEARVPPLRERRDDIELITERMLAARTPAKSTSDLPAGALEMLRAHDWPGNVRELRNAVLRLVLFPSLGREALGDVGPASSGGERGASLDLPLRAAREQVVEDFELRYLTAQLERHGGNITQSAAAMGVSRQFVHRMMERYGLRSRGG